MFIQIKGVGMTSSLLRFFIFYTTSVQAEIQSKDFIFSVRRIIALTFILFFVPALIVWNHTGFILDDVLYPDWRDTHIDRPLFLVGNARSGTTWLHRLIAQDSDNFTSFLCWEILFGVSITWRRVFICLYEFDKRYLFGLQFEVISMIENCLVGGVKVHKVGLQEYEEDEWLMIHIFLNQLVLLFFPLGGGIHYSLPSFDKADKGDLPVYIRKQIFTYYKECVQRHLYARSGNYGGLKSKIFVSKNPAFTMRLEMLYETFPGCRIACLLRDPMQSIPSMISYIAMVCSVLLGTMLFYFILFIIILCEFISFHLILFYAIFVYSILLHFSLCPLLFWPCSDSSSITPLFIPDSIAPVI